MSVQLLDKTRKINRLLHNNSSSKVVFNDICDVLTEIMKSNVLVVSKKGKVLGVGQCMGVELIQELIENKVGSHVDAMYKRKCKSSDTWFFTRSSKRISGNRNTNRHCRREIGNLVHVQERRDI